jgi:hypothetical protein
MNLKASLALWERRLAYRRRKRASVRKHAGRTVTHTEAAHIRKWDRLITEAEQAVAHRRKQLAAAQPLRLRALGQMTKLVGIMEIGGNNTGRQVLEIIRANGGTSPEAWCGDTVAWAYRHAGSKVVQRGWAAVRLLGFLTGMKIVSRADALPGDIVCFKFDHTGILRRKISATEDETIEGNTGRAGAVSDSRTGGDGVYIKRRSTGLVARYVRVTR